MAEAPGNPGDIFDGDAAVLFDENLSISVEGLYAILDEQPIPPSDAPQTISEGLDQGKQADCPVDSDNAIQPHAESSTVTEFNGTLGSQWSTSNSMGVSDCEKEMNLGFSFGSEGSFNCHSFPMNSEIHHVSEHPDPKSIFGYSSWLRLSNDEYNSSSMNLVGSSCDSLMGSNFDNQQLQYLPNTSFDNAEEEGLIFSRGPDFDSDFYLDSGQGDFEQMKAEILSQKRVKEYESYADGMSSFRRCNAEQGPQCNFAHSRNILADNVSSACFADSSHTMMSEKSGLTDGKRYDDRRASGRDSLLEENNLYYSSMHIDSTLLNSFNSKLNATEATNIMYNACDSGYMSYREPPTYNSINGLRNTLHCHFPHLDASHQNELIVQNKDGKDQLLHLQSSSRSCEVQLDTGVESVGSLLHDFPVAETHELLPGTCAEQNHSDDISLKSESSIDSSPLPSSRNSTSDDVHISAFDAPEDLFPNSWTNLHNKQQKASSKIEIEDRVKELHYKQHAFSPACCHHP